MAERCNCDSSCGENRYHDAGDPGCRFAGDDEYNAYWDTVRSRYNMASKAKETTMATNNKVSNKLTKVNENFTINMYDNGYMIEVNGRDKKDEYKTSKIMVSTVEELIGIVREVTEMERTD
jgi:hypothetical protein